MSDDSVLIRTSTSEFALPAERFEALQARLERTEAGGGAAAELRRRHELSDDNKKVVVRTLRLWLEELGRDDMGADLDDLRYELMRDLRIDPWDTDERS